MKFLAPIAAAIALAATGAPAVASAATFAPAPAFQRGWENINARQARLEARIDRGVRSGALSRREAVQLRSDFRRLERLEAQYRRSGGGLSMSERRDLDRRFDALSARIRYEKHDRNGHRR